MKCPLCDCQIRVTDSRFVYGVTKRVRECPKCLTTFKTTEKIEYELIPTYILKKMHDKVERERRPAR